MNIVIYGVMSSPYALRYLWLITEEIIQENFLLDRQIATNSSGIVGTAFLTTARILKI